MTSHCLLDDFFRLVLRAMENAEKSRSKQLIDVRMSFKDERAAPSVRDVEVL